MGEVDYRAFNISLSDPKDRVNYYIDRYKTDDKYDGFDALLMKSIRVTSARAKQSPDDDFEAICTFEIEAVPGLCNPIERMHGGAVALLADMATTMATAPVSSKGFWEFGGVTRTLNITLLQPIPRGAELLVISKLKSIGRRLSVTQCEMKDRSTGKLLAVAEHGKSALEDQDPREKSASRL